MLGHFGRKLSEVVYYGLFAVSATAQGLGAIVDSTPLVAYPPSVLDYQLTSYVLPKQLFAGIAGIWWLERYYQPPNVPADLIVVNGLLLFVLATVAYLVYRNVKAAGASGTGD